MRLCQRRLATSKSSLAHVLSSGLALGVGVTPSTEGHVPHRQSSHSDISIASSCGEAAPNPSAALATRLCWVTPPGCRGLTDSTNFSVIFSLPQLPFFLSSFNFCFSSAFFPFSFPRSPFLISPSLLIFPLFLSLDLAALLPATCTAVLLVYVHSLFLTLVLLLPAPSSAWGCPFFFPHPQSVSS